MHALAQSQPDTPLSSVHRMRASMLHAAAAVLTLVWLAACGSEAPEPLTATTNDVFADGAALNDAVTANDGSTTAPDTQSSSSVDASKSAGGGPGAPCAGDGECESGACVLARAGGKRCAASCDAQCPAGKRCVYAQAYQRNLCVDAHLTLCDPCTTSLACRHLGGDASACVTWGAAGNFCGSWCETDSDCPTSFSCTSGKDVGGLVVKQCRPTGGAACACSQSAVASGASTTCGTGSCLGKRTCLAAGLSTCSAPTGTAEVCDGKDNDCDGETDEPGAKGCTKGYIDNDGDGFGAGSPGACSCGGGGVSKGGDCNDSKKSAYPGAKETCDGIDNNCDGKTDEAGASGCKTYYQDADKDGYGGSKKACLCKASAAYSASKGGDCADTDKTVFPGKIETCNGKDDNCTGGKDEGGVCAPNKPQVCYPGVDNKYTLCFGLVALSSVKTAAYTWPASSASNYQPPVYVLNLNTVSGATKVAANFALNELMQASKGTYGVFTAQAVARLQAVRSQLGTSLHVNSGFRSPGYNKTISGAALLSRHQWGDAADVTTKGKTSLQKIIDVCKANSADYTQLYTSHVHCDWRNDPPGPDFWPKKSAPPPPEGTSPPPPPPSDEAASQGEEAPRGGARHSEHRHESRGRADHQGHDHSTARRDAAWRRAWEANLWAQPHVNARFRRGATTWVQLAMTWGAAFDEGTPWVTWTVRTAAGTRVIEPRVHVRVAADAWVCWEVGATLHGCAVADDLAHSQPSRLKLSRAARRRTSSSTQPRSHP